MPDMWVSKEVRDTCYKNRDTFDEEGKPRTICHHIDLNHDNNDPENLIFLSKSEHNSLHNKGKLNPMYGKHPKDVYSPEVYETWRAKCKGSWTKLNKARTGILLTDEHRKHISEGTKLRFITQGCSLETRQKLSKSKLGNKSLTGRHWYNNGTKNVAAFECPEGYVPGKLSKKRIDVTLLQNGSDDN